MHMRTTLNIDDDLLEKASKLTGCFIPPLHADMTLREPFLVRKPNHLLGVTTSPDSSVLSMQWNTLSENFPFLSLGDFGVPAKEKDVRMT